MKVCVCGACGKMGSEVVKSLKKENDMVLVGAVDIFNIGRSIGDIIGTDDVIVISDNLKKTLEESKPDIMIELTSPKSVYSNTKIALEYGIPVVIGATGLTNKQIVILEKIADEKGIGVLWATNFAIGAILMMEFAVKAAKYFKNVEIIEYHHDNKLDAPSGTSLKTASLIEKVKESHKLGNSEEKELTLRARGAEIDGVRIHSVRLPGFIAHQEVIFGDVGQVFTIRHDSMNRESFMPGVIMACRNLIGKKGFIEGLEGLGNLTL